jgi:hypothetical protein
MFDTRKSRGTNKKSVFTNGHEATMKNNFSWVGVILSFFVVVVPLQSFFAASEANSLCEIEYSDRKLTVNINNIELGKVLTVIQEKTGIEFVLGQKQSKQLVSFLFESIPLSQSLIRILGRYDHAIVYCADSQPIKVIIFENGFSDSPNQLAGERKTSTKKILNSSFLPQIVYPEQDTKETLEITSFSQRIDNNQSAGQDPISSNSPGAMVPQPLASQQMIIPTTSEVMDIQLTPSSIDRMIIQTTSEVMDIQPTPSSIDRMIIPTASEVMDIQPTPLWETMTMPQIEK